MIQSKEDHEQGGYHNYLAILSTCNLFKQNFQHLASNWQFDVYLSIFFVCCVEGHGWTKTMESLCYKPNIHVKLLFHISASLTSCTEKVHPS